jgi:hypothetical protein
MIANLYYGCYNKVNKAKENNMKVYFNHGFMGMTGKSDDSIYYYHSKCKVCLVRDKPKFKPNERTDKMKAIMANLRLLNPSQTYKQDFVDYLYHYNNLKENRKSQLISWNNLYMKLLYKLAKVNPGVNLLTLSREQIYNENLPCKCLREAIDAGLLPMVDGYKRFSNCI